MYERALRRELRSCLKNAELDAQLMQKEAKDMAEKIAEENEAMKNRFIDFRTKYKKLLQSELQRFESLSGEMFPELGVDDFDDLPEATEKKEGCQIGRKIIPDLSAGLTDTLKITEEPICRKQ